MSGMSYDDRTRLNAELARIDTAIAEADQALERAPGENHTEWQRALDEKAGLLRRRHTLEQMAGYPHGRPAVFSE